MFTLDGILGLVGTLDDALGDDTPRERFRRFLRESVGTTGAVRDYIEACVRNKGSQYDHALQDLVNHAASLIGFEVEFGRYRGVANDIGFDGLWRREGFSVVAEVKTTDAYAIQTATLVGYVDRLISEGRIADWDHAMGLYVVARTDAQLTQLANSILAEKRTHQLRIATVETVLSLAELVQDGHVTPDEAVGLLRPAGVFVADTVQLLTRVASGTPNGAGSPGIAGDGADASIEPEPTSSFLPTPSPKQRSSQTATSDRVYLMAPVRDEPEMSAKDTVRELLEAGWYVFGETTPGRKRLKPGDRICFYESGVGVIADAEAATRPERQPPAVHGLVRDLEKYPWSFRVKNPRFFFDKPIVIDAAMRENLDAFASREPARSWSWFVQGTRSLSKHDYELLTGRAASQG